jgi:hypothetical protein
MKLILVLLAGLVLLPLICSAQNLDSSKDWNSNVSVYVLAAGMSGDTTVHKTGSGLNAFRYDVWTQGPEFG